MKEVVIAVIAGVFSGAFFSFVQFLISRKDERKNDLSEIKKDLSEIKKQQAKTEKDSIRTQMLMLMNNYAENEQEILTLAEYYFHELKANFYMTSMFQKWLHQNNVEVPGWFQKED